jgi:thiamine-phosphate pyrophosphorylase
LGILSDNNVKNKQMKIIVITSPEFFQAEKEIIQSLFDSGLEILHLRKPEATKEQYARFIESIPETFHNKIVLHDFFDLSDRYNIKGIHLNKRNPTIYGNKKIAVSKSCHSVTELNDIDTFEYVFLSPIFDSISKTGYNSGFTKEELSTASDKGLINDKVIALGGIDFSTIPTIKNYKFGGIALLGHIWNNPYPIENYKLIQKEIENN